MSSEYRSQVKVLQEDFRKFGLSVIFFPVSDHLHSSTNGHMTAVNTNVPQVWESQWLDSNPPPFLMGRTKASHVCALANSVHYDSAILRMRKSRETLKEQYARITALLRACIFVPVGVYFRQIFQIISSELHLYILLVNTITTEGSQSAPTQTPCQWLTALNNQSADNQQGYVIILGDSLQMAAIFFCL